ncbi:MAG TPA: YtxH domain-containing protein [Terriglobales bacterium]|nr:YtxH domain-containing protein [Terriglobales bacterium]
MSDDRSNNLGWFLAGMGIGAVVGILYAPKSGRETREALMTSADEGREYLMTRGREAREQISSIVDRSKDTIGRQKEQINSAIEAGRQAYREATTEKKS